MNTRLTKLTLLCLTTTACSVASDDPLTGAELAKQVTGHRFSYSGPLYGTLFSGVMQFNENGNLYVETDSGIPEGGTWRILSDQLCLKLVALRAGEENCFSVRATNRGSFKTSHGFEIERLKDE